MPEWVCNFLRGRLLPATAPTQSSPERIYISREGAQSRRLVNEPRLLEVLARYGFTPVRLETMSFTEQVRLFQSAKCIVAPHGAGLANLVFCEPDASVVEILPSEHTNLCYWLLSQQVSLKYYYVLGSLTGPPVYDIEVDPDKLQSTLNLALHSSATTGRVHVTV
jgi:capsular polysaccharide biosynthesis protein